MQLFKSTGAESMEMKCEFIIFSTLKISVPCLLALIATVEKLAVNLTIAHWKADLFSLATLKIFSWTLIFCNFLLMNLG
jgi:hypothetical protein